jgi:hypothetical protein
MRGSQIVGFLLLMAFAQPVQAEDGPVSVAVVIAGDVPRQVHVDDGSSGVDLVSTDHDASFSGSISVANDQNFHSMRLVADYGNEPEQSIPLRVRSGMDSIRLRLPHLTNLSCDGPTVFKIEQNTSFADDLLQSYLVARDLHFSVNVSNGCGSYMLKRVDKAWFDRSYALTLLRPYFALDEDARSAYAQYDSAYAQNYADQDAAHALALLNSERVRLARSGDLTAALAINDSMVNALQSDSHLKTNFEKLQRLPLSQLVKESNAFRVKLGN